jgi:cystathionine beta-lyase/cystathionine gamma-synthase
MAAITCTMLAVLRPGDHVVAPRALYASTYSLFSTFLPDVGIWVSFVDGTDPAAYAAAVGAKTKLLYLESPANPTLALTDVSAVVSIARECGLITVMDNTLATPVNQRPLDLGVDVVVHSATKYLGGHADLVAGVIVGDAEVIDRVRWNTNKLLGPWAVAGCAQTEGHRSIQPSRSRPACVRGQEVQVQHGSARQSAGRPIESGLSRWRS